MLFRARLIPVFLYSLLFLLAGCEERPDTATVSTSFELVAPKDGSKVSDISTGKIKIKYFGNNIKLSSNILLELNGADVTNEFGLNNISDRAIVPFLTVRNSLVQGDNVLRAAEVMLDETSGCPVLEGSGCPALDVNGAPALDESACPARNNNCRPVLVVSQTFHFYLDSVPPRISVNSVVPNAVASDGISPAAGSTITVNGELIDASAITDLQFTSPAGTQVLTLTTNDPVEQNEFNNITKTFSVDLQYPDSSVPVASPHFSYVITDDFGHSRTEQYMASGTPIVTQQALQINDSLAVNFTPILNGLVANAFTLVKSGTDFFGMGQPYRLNTTTAPVAGDFIENPLDNCATPPPYPPLTDAVTECFPAAYPGVRVLRFPATNPACRGLLFRESSGVTDCVVFIKNVEMNTPAVDVEFGQHKDDLMVNLSLWFKDVYADIEIAGIQLNSTIFGDYYIYQGGAKGRISISQFTVETDFRLYQDSSAKIGIERVTPVRLELTDLLKVPVLTGTCDICSDYISGWTFLAFAFGVDFGKIASAFTNEDIPDINKTVLIDMISEAIEEKIIEFSPKVGDTPILSLNNPMGGLLSSSTILNQNATTDKQIISNSSVVDAYALYRNNAHFVFDGSDKVSPAFYSPDYLPVNGGLGSTFAAQGQYYNNLVPFIKGWGITIGGLHNVDLSYAISANSVNQWLLANHQTAMFNEMAMTITAADFDTGDFDIDPADELSLTLNTNEAPSVQFISEDPRSGQVCNGANCITKEAKPGAVKLVVNDLDIKLTSNTNEVILDANIDLEFEVTLTVSGGKPLVSLKENTLTVKVNDFNKPDDNPLVTNSVLALTLAESIEVFMASSGFQKMLIKPISSIFLSMPFIQQTDPVNDPGKFLMELGDLPGLGGSGVGCSNPVSVNGQICAGGVLVPYAALFAGGLIPTDFSLLFRWLSIEKNGTYLSFGIDVNRQPPSENSESSFITVSLTD